MTHPAPYRSTQVFSDQDLPQALRRAHATKAGTWGILKIIEGSVLFVIEESGARHNLCAPQSIIIVPEQLHHVEPLGAMKMQVDFYRELPTLPI